MCCVYLKTVVSAGIEVVTPFNASFANTYSARRSIVNATDPVTGRSVSVPRVVLTTLFSTNNGTDDVGVTGTGRTRRLLQQLEGDVTLRSTSAETVSYSLFYVSTLACSELCVV